MVPDTFGQDVADPGLHEFTVSPVDYFVVHSSLAGIWNSPVYKVEPMSDKANYVLNKILFLAHMYGPTNLGYRRCK